MVLHVISGAISDSVSCTFITGMSSSWTRDVGKSATKHSDGFKVNIDRSEVNIDRNEVEI